MENERTLLIVLKLSKKAEIEICNLMCLRLDGMDLPKNSYQPPAFTVTACNKCAKVGQMKFDFPLETHL